MGYNVNLGDLKFKNSIIWNVQLFDLIGYKNAELKLNFVSDIWMRIFISATWIDSVSKNKIEKCHFVTKTEILNHSLAQSKAYALGLIKYFIRSAPMSSLSVDEIQNFKS